LRDKGEGLQAALAKDKDKLSRAIQPLNELGEREVKTPEVEKVRDDLSKVLQD
jgi:hypothetical protein